MPIKSGEVIESAEVLGAFGFTIAMAAQAVFNADYEGWNAAMGDGQGLPIQTNMKYVAAKSGTNWTAEYDSSNTTMFTPDPDGTANIYYAATIVDEFDDASVDSNIWTSSTTGTSTITESSGSLTCASSQSGGTAGTATATADQANATDYKAATADSEVLMNCAFGSSTSGTASSDARLEITDTSSAVILLRMQSVNGSTPGNPGGYVRMVFDKSGQEVHVYVDGVEDGSSPFDLSSLSNYYIRMVAGASTSGGGDTASASMGSTFLREVVGDGNSKVFQTLATTHGSTITNAILVSNTDSSNLNGGSVSYKISADNGANFEAVTLNEIHNFTNTGTQLIIQLTFTEDTTIDETASHDWTPIWKGEFMCLYNIDEA